MTKTTKPMPDKKEIKRNIFWVIESVEKDEGGQSLYWTGDTTTFFSDKPKVPFWTKDIHNVIKEQR